MQIKFVHGAMKQFASSYDRRMELTGNGVRTVYHFKNNIPFVKGKAVVTYSEDEKDNVVYDYSALLKAETSDDVNKFEHNIGETFKLQSYKIKDITVEEYTRIIHDNTTVASKMKELEKQENMLKELGAI